MVWGVGQGKARCFVDDVFTQQKNRGTTTGMVTSFSEEVYMFSFWTRRKGRLSKKKKRYMHAGRVVNISRQGHRDRIIGLLTCLSGL